MFEIKTMNRYFVSLIVALGSLGFTASNALAGVDQKIPVTFRGLAATSCNVGTIAAATQGILTAADSITLTTTAPGVIAGIVCNTDHSVSVGTPVQQTPTLAIGEIAGETLPSDAVYVATAEDTFGSITSLGDSSALSLPIGGLAAVNALTVSMSAQKADGSVLKAGVYKFEVPVTITCN